MVLVDSVIIERFYEFYVKQYYMFALTLSRSLLKVLFSQMLSKLSPKEVKSCLFVLLKMFI